MKASLSYTDSFGVTTRLAFLADHVALTEQAGGSESGFSASELAESFESCLQEMPKELLQAHLALSLSLVAASYDLPQSKGSDILPERAKDERK